LASSGTRIRHAYGEILLPAPPRRVVSLGFTAHDTVLALGVMPVALRHWFGDQPGGLWPWARPLARGPQQPILLPREISVEAVAVLEPDLIIGIGSGISPEQYAVLSRIAPVLMHSADRPPFGMAWHDVVQSLGQALERQSQAEKLIAGLRETFAAARARRPEWAGRSAVAAYNHGGESGVFMPEDTRSRFLSELGFVAPAALGRLSRTQGFFAPLSPEDLSPLDADLLLWVSSLGQVPEIVSLPLRRFLRAHVEGREVLTSPLAAAALSFGSVLSLPFALEALEAEIALASDGSAATQVPSAVKAGLAP
jgi:iron complex transport system substrate-binding protein